MAIDISSLSATAIDAHALSFDDPDYVALDQSFDTQGQFSELTVSAWIQSTAADNTAVRSLVSFDDSHYFRLGLDSSGQVVFWTADETGSSGGVIGDSVTDGDLHHVVGVYDGTDQVIYIDGVEVARTPEHGSNDIGTGTTRYGFLGTESDASSYDGSRQGYPYPGLLDDVRIYDRALSASEIAALADRMHVTGGLLSHWRFDEGQGSTAADATGNGNAGELFGPDWTGPYSGATIRLAWDETADEEREYSIWRDREGYDYADSRGEVTTTNIVNAGGSIAGYEAARLDPNTTYDYHVQVEGTGTSNSDQLGPESATTDGPDVPTTRTRDGEWTVELTLPDRTLRPPVTDEPELHPAANDLPEIRIPTTDGPWTEVALENVERMRVWYQGELLPIEDCQRVEETDSGAVLEGRGGTELLDSVVGEVVRVSAVSNLVEEVINAESNTLTPVVDDFDRSEHTDSIATVSTASEWADALAAQSLETLPATVDDNTGELVAQQSLWTQEQRSSSGNGQEYSGDWTSDGYGSYVTIPTNDLPYTFSPEYTIPEENLVVYVRCHADSAGHPQIGISIDGNPVTSIPADSLSTDLQWFELLQDNYSGGDLAPGDHTVTLEGISDDDGHIKVDVVAPGDGRPPYNLDNSVTTAPDGSNYLDGPELYPPTVPVETDPVLTVEAVEAASISSTWNDTSRFQQIQVSKDGGQSWYPSGGPEENTDSVSVDFSVPGDRVSARFTLSSFGTQTSTPGTGIEPQRVESFELDATLSDRPLADSRHWETEFRSMLQRLADQSGAVWDVQRGSNGDLELHWTWPGQRTATVESPVTTYDVATDTSSLCEQVVVKGGNGSVAGERLTADPGNTVGLEETRIVAGSETVRNPDTDERYEVDDDYQLHLRDGGFEALPTGDIDDGETLAIDYEFTPVGSWSVVNPPNSRTIVREITSLTSDRQCARAARILVNALSEPLEEAEVGVAPQPQDWSVVDSLSIDAIPLEGSLRTVDTRTQPGEARILLGSRRSEDAFIEQIRSSVDQISERT